MKREDWPKRKQLHQLRVCWVVCTLTNNICVLHTKKGIPKNTRVAPRENQKNVDSQVARGRSISYGHEKGGRKEAHIMHTPILERVGEIPLENYPKSSLTT
jgi:hypothetical protein